MAENKSQKSGTLYGVGVGPGAPDLLTLRAEQILRACPVICLPTSTQGQSYAGGIIEHLLDRTWQEVVQVQFPMQRDPALAQSAREQAATKILGYLQADLDVAFATEGDPLLYSTFGYLLEAVRREAPAIRIEVIPGISSITAAAAAASLSLAAWDERVAILPAAYVMGQAGSSDLRQMLRLFNTVVLLKVNTVFDAVLDVLEASDLAQHAVFVRRCSTDHEEIEYDLARLRKQKLDYFSLVIVRNPYATGNQ
ncbi:MAG: precorrin-2 C(20)-methyltransferase [Ktedonobacteraceae bacterium]|nr:precorrin-2 C(20)-methyltransferase [Ktedonobacteraceae bacterium]